MTEINPACAAGSTTGRPAAPAGRSRRIAGVDSVPGDPVVPLSVWYVAGERSVASKARVDGWPAVLAGRRWPG